MYKIDILKSIDDISTSIANSEINVCESMLDAYNKSVAILENYEGDDISSFNVFTESFIMEASQSEIKKESGIVSVIRKIRDAIAKMIVTILKKLGVKGLDPEKIGDLSTPEKMEKAIEKVEKTHKKHPIITISASVVGGAAAIYGGTKGIEALEKHVAWKELDDDEKELVKKVFVQKTHSFNIPFDVSRIGHVMANTSLELKKIHKNLCKVEDSVEKIEEFCKANGISSIKKDLKGICDEMDEERSMSFEDTKTYAHSVEDYNKRVLEFREDENRAKSIVVLAGYIDKKCWDMVLKIKDEELKKSVNKDIDAIMKYIKKIIDTANYVTNIGDEFDKITEVMNRFLPKYYSVERTVNTIKKDLGSALETSLDVAKQFKNNNH